MTKLLVRDDFCLVDGEVVPAYDWYNPRTLAYIIVSGWFGEQTIIATDRYTLDVDEQAKHHDHLSNVS